MAGVFGWKQFEDYVFVVFLIISILQLLTLVGSKFFKSSEELLELLKLKNLYTKYFNSLEEIWVKYNNNHISEEEATKKYYSLKRKAFTEIDNLAVSLNVIGYSFLEKKSNSRAHHYFTYHHNNG